MSLKLKICGYRSALPSDAWDGVDFVGINLIPTSKRYFGSTGSPPVKGGRENNDPIGGFTIDIPWVQNIEPLRNIELLLSSLPPHVQTVAVTRDMALDELLEIQEMYHFDFLQLHGNEDAEYGKTLKNLGYRVIKACTYLNYRDFEDYPCDYLLIDGQNPGSGEAYDYSTLEVSRSFFLAGGLNIGNIDQVKNIPHLYALDIASGVETDGHIDPLKVQEIVAKL